MSRRNPLLLFYWWNIQIPSVQWHQSYIYFQLSKQSSKIFACVKHVWNDSKNTSNLSKELPRISSQFSEFFRKKNVQSYYGRSPALSEKRGSTNSSRGEAPFVESLIFPDFVISPLWAPLEPLQFLISEHDGEVDVRCIYIFFPAFKNCPIRWNDYLGERKRGFCPNLSCGGGVWGAGGSLKNYVPATPGNTGSRGVPNTSDLQLISCCICYQHHY